MSAHADRLLRKLQEKATQGPWYDDYAITGEGSVVMSSAIGHRVAHLPHDNHKADSAFIAAVVNALPALLDVVKAARQECKKFNFPGDNRPELYEALRALDKSLG